MAKGLVFYQKHQSLEKDFVQADKYFAVDRLLQLFTVHLSPLLKTIFVMFAKGAWLRIIGPKTTLDIFPRN